MKGYVLVTAKHIQHGARGAGKTLKVLDCARVNIDAAQALEFGFGVANTGMSSIEADCAASKATKKMEVFYRLIIHEERPQKSHLEGGL